MFFKSLVVNKNALLVDVLQKIDKNLCGFVVVVDNYNVLVGVMTDGDLRRLIIQYNDINISINQKYSSSFVSADINSSFFDLAELFNSSGVDYIPITENKILINIITKKQFHDVVLRDKKINMLDKNHSFVKNQEDEDIYHRPWGFYKTTFINKYSQSKIIFIFPKQELSLQMHKQREEHWIVTKGQGEVILGESVKKAHAGMYFYVPKGCKHKIKNVSEESNLIITEVQLGTYFGEEDIIRYEDIYGRV
jgi:mannose-1-phosphate guanylyltransferase / mannose-6-phosphate isomerase